MLAALLFCLLATAARGQLRQQLVPGPNVVITQTQEVLNKRIVTEPSQPVVSTFVQQEVQRRTVLVPVPGAVRTSTVVQQSQQVIPVRGGEVMQAYNTVRGADTYHARATPQIVTVPVKREAINKRVVERVQNQQPVTHLTITSVNVVPVTSISYYTRY